jgi:hypothetical protein
MESSKWQALIANISIRFSTAPAKKSYTRRQSWPVHGHGKIAYPRAW